MKYLVLIAVVLAVLWLLRAGRRGTSDEVPPPRRSPTLEPPQDMIRCAVCSVHLPRTEALPGPGERWYCCEDHRQRARP